jgi:hypothetical protein
VHQKKITWNGSSRKSDKFQHRSRENYRRRRGRENQAVAEWIIVENFPEEIKESILQIYKSPKDSEEKSHVLHVTGKHQRQSQTLSRARLEKRKCFQEIIQLVAEFSTKIMEAQKPWKYLPRAERNPAKLELGPQQKYLAKNES